MWSPKVMTGKNVQKSGSHSTNVQVEGDLNQGLTYTEARQVAEDVFKSNFYVLSGEAKKVATERAEYIIEKFISKMQSDNPHGINVLKDPDFQYNLFTAQSHYARSGDKELADLLVDLLIQRSEKEERDILQIVLNESVEVASKLTNDHLSILSLVFIIRNTVNLGLISFVKLDEYLDNYVKPFKEILTDNDVPYKHLQYLGCGSISVIHNDLEVILGKNYIGLFQEGFDATVVEELGLSQVQAQKLFVNCLNDNSKLQINALNEDSLNRIFEEIEIENQIEQKLNKMLENHKMSDDDIKLKIIEVRPYMKDIFEKWNKSYIKAFDLTSVGIAIGHANLKRNLGSLANLSIWIK